jgi:3-deoxy-7-phosphoheptulonate synthase
MSIRPESLYNTNKYSAFALWQPHTWRDFEAQQQPNWGSMDTLQLVGEQLKGLPGLVGAAEIEALKQYLADAGMGRRFILQGGDCAERFQDCREDVIRRKLQILLQMALVMGFAGRKPIVPIGRMAGQYAKPRSVDIEDDGSGSLVPIFRGESVNGYAPTPSSRKADPSRLLQAYHASSATLNFIRLLMGSGFGDLRQMDHWELLGSSKGTYGKRFEQITQGLRDALEFISSCSHEAGSASSAVPGFKDFFVSHEALLLPYEESLTRFVPEMGRFYNLSTHMVWIGDRTRRADGAHVEYCRGIGNPVGVKIGSDVDCVDLLNVISKINPHNEIGKVSLITRIGAGDVRRLLPDLIKAVRQSGIQVTWIVDPMHGNTVRASDGRKTRRFEDIVSEVKDTFDVHYGLGSVLGGVHLEMTADEVTECTGGVAGPDDTTLASRYETWCDPRLNRAQSLELAFHVAACLRSEQSRILN